MFSAVASCSLGCNRMTDSVKARMEADLKDAMKAGDVTARETLRFTLAALKNAEIDKRSALSPSEEMDVLKTQAKRRGDSIEQYRAAGRGGFGCPRTPQ